MIFLNWWDFCGPFMPWSMESTSEAAAIGKLSPGAPASPTARNVPVRCDSHDADVDLGKLGVIERGEGKHILCLKRKMNHDKLDVHWFLMNMMVGFDLTVVISHQSNPFMVRVYGIDFTHHNVLDDDQSNDDLVLLKVFVFSLNGKPQKIMGYVKRTSYYTSYCA